MVQLMSLQISWEPALHFTRDEMHRMADRGVSLGINGSNANITNQDVINLFIAYDKEHNSPAPINVVNEYLRSVLVSKPKPQVSERRLKELDGPDLEF